MKKKEKKAEDNLLIETCLCKYCGEIIGLETRACKVGDNDSNVIFSDEPCEQCKKNMEHGIMIVETENGQKDIDMPVRTGRYIVIDEKSFKSLFKIGDKKKARFFFMENSLFENVFGKEMKQEDKT